MLVGPKCVLLFLATQCVLGDNMFHTADYLFSSGSFFNVTSEEIQIQSVGDMR